MLSRRSLKRTNASTFFLIALPLLLLLTSCTNANPSYVSNVSNSSNVAGIRPFIDTWNNVHTFQTFDYNITNPATIAKNYDAIWGAQLNHVQQYRSANPNIFLSYYIPFHRDWGVFPGYSSRQSLAYWQKNHPDWVLYKCDRVTPAYEFGDPNVPLDIANTALVPWQVQTYALPASESGYDSIGADNITLQNLFGACGVYIHGQWTQRYTGQKDDPQWSKDVLNWLKQTQKALHQLKHPLSLIINFSLGNLSLNNLQVRQLVSYTDGILDESGFSNEGDGYVTDSHWIDRIVLMLSMQQQQKVYYLITSYTTVKQADIQWALASYLMGKGHMASLFISRVQGYGTDLSYNHYTMQIGSPLDSMYAAQHVYFREYSHGLSIVNPSATKSYTVTLNPVNRYHDMYDNPVSQTVTIRPHTGLVLLTQ